MTMLILQLQSLLLSVWQRAVVFSFIAFVHWVGFESGMQPTIVRSQYGEAWTFFHRCYLESIYARVWNDVLYGMIGHSNSILISDLSPILRHVVSLTTLWQSKCSVVLVSCIQFLFTKILLLRFCVCNNLQYGSTRFDLLVHIWRIIEQTAQVVYQPTHSC